MSALHRTISSTNVEENDGSARTEPDSHADTCVAGSNTLLIESTDKTVTVSPFSGEYSPTRNVPVATVATAWDDPTTGQTYILIINQALYFGNRVAGTLLCPNQMRQNGVTVDDVPRQFDASSTHSLFFPKEDLRIPLDMKGVISGFTTRKPTWEEYNSCPQVEVTSPDTWSPYAEDFADKEKVVTEMREKVITKSVARVSQAPEVEKVKEMNMPHGDFRCAYAINRMRDASSLPEFRDDLADRLISAVNVASDDILGDGLDGHADEDVYTITLESRKLYALSTDEKKSVLTHETLARRWKMVSMQQDARYDKLRSLG